MVFSIEPDGICALTIRKLSTNKAIIKATKIAISHWISSDVVEFLQEKNLLGRTCCLKKKEEEKKSNVWVWVLAIVGGIAVIAGIAYAVYRYLTPDYMDDFDDDFDDDLEDDFFDDEDEEPEKEEKKPE